MKKVTIKISKIIAIIIVILFIITAGLIVYMNHSPYNTAFNSVDLRTYLNINNFNVLNYTDDDKLEIILSNDSVNSIVSNGIKNNLNKTASSLKVNDIKLDLEEHKIFMNGKYKFFKVPLSAKINFNKVDEQITINLQDLKLGNKNLGVPKFLYFMFKPILNIKLSLNNFMNLNFLEIQEIDIVKNKLKVECAINEQKMEAMFGLLDKYLDPSITELYTNSKLNVLSIQFIKLLNNQNIAQDETNVLKSAFSDFFGEQKYLQAILTALNVDGLKEFFNKYNGFITNKDITYDTVMQKKSHLLLTDKVKFGQAFLKQLESDIQKDENYLLSDYGKLYNVYSGDYITIESINEQYNLFDKEIYNYDLENTEYYYDTQNEEIVIKHKLNSKQYLIIHDEKYEVISTEEGKQRYPTKLNTKEVKLLAKDSSERVEIEEFLKSIYNKDNIYTRYLKSDGKNAYAVVSFNGDYQQINSIALQKKDDKWEIIKNNGTYRNIIDNSEDYNVKVLPNYRIQDITVRKLSIRYGTPVIVKELKLKNIYPNNSNVQIKFCSYIGNYVYVVLTDDKEYVLRVEQGFYKEILARDEAEKVWELPDLMLIQK